MPALSRKLGSANPESYQVPEVQAAVAQKGRQQKMRKSPSLRVAALIRSMLWMLWGPLT